MCFVEDALILIYILGQPQPGHRKNWSTSPQAAVKGTNKAKDFNPHPWAVLSPAWEK